MSIFRKPKGTYIRSTPDWFSSLACAGFGFCPSLPLGQAPAVGLFNNDNSGRSLFVYGLGAEVNNGAEVANFSYFNGPLTALYSPTAAAPIDPLLAALPGQIYGSGLTPAQQATPAVSVQQGLYIMGSFAGSGSGPIDHIVAEHPIAIVRPGFTLAGWTFNSGLGVWFHYVVLDF
jgi:hypothetical protein